MEAGKSDLMGQWIRKRQNQTTPTNYVLTVLLAFQLFFNSPSFISAVPLSVQVPDTKVDAGENTLTTQFQRTQQSRAPYCRYKSGTFALGEEVHTEEACLKCHCQRTAVVCKLRMCRDMPNPPPPGCIVVHRAKKCCAELVCPDTNRKNSREQRLSAAGNTSLVLPQATGEKGFCIHEGTVYAEGSAMQSSSLCEYCFCIRGEMKCSSPQCVIPLNGCKPKFRSYACCPTNYDCNESNATAILKTIPTSTPIPSFLKGCQVQGRFIQDGEPVLPIQLGQEINRTNLCQTCFCMGGVVRCRPLECDRPIEGCRPIISDGHCCPDRYQCDNNTTNGLSQAKTIQENSDPSQGVEALPLAAPTKLLDEKNLKNKSEIGSREQRRNRDKDDFAVALKTSYEHEDDTGREESLSFEHGGHNQASSLSFEGSSDQSNSRVEFDSNLEPASEIEPRDSSSNEESDVLAFVTESENEIEDVTTISPSPLDTTIAAEHNVSTTTATSHTTSTSTKPASETTFDSNAESTTTSPEEDTAPNLGTLSTPASISISEMTAVSTNATDSPTHPTTLSTTLGNLHFIPFGVEDAVVGDLNAPVEFESALPSPPSPPQIQYDQNALKTSLIQPTPPKGYVHVPLKLEPSHDEITSPIITIPSTDNFKDDLLSKNPIIDIPISASLYNNGYFSNGIPPPANLTGFPGQVFEEPGDSIGAEDAIVGNRSQDEAGSLKANATMTSPPLEIKNGNLELDSPPNLNNPSRTYSKFGIQDAPFHRYGFETGSFSRNENPLKSVGAESFPQARDEDDRFYAPLPQQGQTSSGYNPYGDYEQEEMYDDSFEKGIQQEQKLLNSYRFETHEGFRDSTTTTTAKPQHLMTTSTRPTTTSTTPTRLVTKTKAPANYHGGFKPVVAFPFMIPKNKPLDSLFNIGLKLSGCNIYGKMYMVGKVILELSSPCLQCECTEVGVQCTELPC